VTRCYSYRITRRN